MIVQEKNSQAHIHVFQRYVGEGVEQRILVISKQQWSKALKGHR